MTDFEASLRKALKQFYPKAKSRGCWFHYRKCILKKIKRLGILKLWTKSAREKNPKLAANARIIYKMICYLPLLPEKHFAAGYLHIVNKAAELKLNKVFSKFFAYFERTWNTEVRYIFVMAMYQYTNTEIFSVHSLIFIDIFEVN